MPGSDNTDTATPAPSDRPALTVGRLIMGLALLLGCAGLVLLVLLRPSPAAPLVAPSATASPARPAPTLTDAPSATPLPASPTAVPTQQPPPPTPTLVPTAVPTPLPPDTPTPTRVLAPESIAVVNRCSVPAPPDPGQVNLATDLSYNRVGGQDLLLDVAWPKSAGPHPMVVVIHGGGWQREDRAAMRDVILVLAGAGYTAASVDYRLVAGVRNRFPVAVQDVRCATRWLRKEAVRFGGDPARVAALGRSAGGHLASMLGVASDVAGLDGPCPAADAPVDVAAVVSYYGLEDLRSSAGWRSDVLDLLTTFLGGPPEANPARAALASPITHIDAGDPPFLLLHGTADEVVPVGQSRAMNAALHAAGVPSTLVEIPGAPHAFFEFGTTADLQPASCTTLAFLDAILKP